MTDCTFNGWADFQSYMALGIFIGVFAICAASILTSMMGRRRRG